MDRLSCNVIYVNRVIDEDRLLRAAPDTNQVVDDTVHSEWKRDHVRELVQPLLDTFGDGTLLSIYFGWHSPICTHPRIPSLLSTLTAKHF